MEKLDFELAVVSTEKQAFQKELDKQDIELRKMTKEVNESSAKIGLLEDENKKMIIQNSEYRDLILRNEEKLKQQREECMTLKKDRDIRDEHIVRLNDECEQLKGIIQELQLKIVEEQDEKLQIMEENRQISINAIMGTQDEQLKAKFLSFQNESEFKKKEWEA